MNDDDKMTDNMRTDSNQKDKQSYQQAGISMGQESWGTKSPESTNRGIKRK